MTYTTNMKFDVRCRREETGTVIQWQRYANDQTRIEQWLRNYLLRIQNELGPGWKVELVLTQENLQW